MPFDLVCSTQPPTSVAMDSMQQVNADHGRVRLVYIPEWMQGQCSKGYYGGSDQDR